jgi:hypothetical protein
MDGLGCHSLCRCSAQGERGKGGRAAGHHLSIYLRQQRPADQAGADEAQRHAHWFDAMVGEQ